MSVAMSRSDGVTVFTLTSDPNSACPPLCQLVGALCYSPGFCAVKKNLLRQRGGPQTTLGALWIITGFMHIGLGLVFLLTRGAPYWWLKETYASLWLGGLFIFFGLSCVLSEKNPRPILILLNAILNLAGVGLAITAIVWYAQGLDNVGFYEMCWSEDYDYWSHPRATLSPHDKTLLERCQEARLLLRTFSISISILLVALSSVDACLGLSAAIVSFRSLARGTRAGGYQPLPQEEKTVVQENQEEKMTSQEQQEQKTTAQEDTAEVQETVENNTTAQEPQ